jgi:hypothetical protein
MQILQQKFKITRTANDNIIVHNIRQMLIYAAHTKWPNYTISLFNALRCILEKVDVNQKGTNQK